MYFNSEHVNLGSDGYLDIYAPRGTKTSSSSTGRPADSMSIVDLTDPQPGPSNTPYLGRHGNGGNNVTAPHRRVPQTDPWVVIDDSEYNDSKGNTCILNSKRYIIIMFSSGRQTGGQYFYTPVSKQNTLCFYEGSGWAHISFRSIT